MTPLIDLDSPLASCFYSVPSKRGAPFISILTMSHLKSLFPLFLMITSSRNGYFFYSLHEACPLDFYPSGV